MKSKPDHGLTYYYQRIRGMNESPCMIDNKTNGNEINQNFHTKNSSDFCELISLMCNVFGKASTIAGSINYDQWPRKEADVETQCNVFR